MPQPPGMVPVSTMSDLNAIAKKSNHALLADSGKRAPEDPKQRRLMVGSLCLLLLALGVVLWHDRDFWFPDAPDAESDQPTESSPAKQAGPARPSAAAVKPVTAARSKHRSKHQVASAVQTPRSIRSGCAGGHHHSHRTAPARSGGCCRRFPSDLAARQQFRAAGLATGRITASQ